MRTSSLAALLLLTLPAATLLAPTAAAAFCDRTSTGLVAINDLGAGTYLGAQGGFYPGGGNERPATHTAAGEALSRLAVPRNVAGLPDPVAGVSVFLSIGMSNTNQEFSSFVTQSRLDPLKHPQVRAVNGAIGGMDAVRISDPNAPYWAQVEQILASQGLSPLQVQAVWLKEAIAGPGGPALTHAARLQQELAEIVFILQAKFPNLHLVYASSRIYAGYASTGLNPEPYAYASAFSVKWLVESQLNGSLALAGPKQPAGAAPVAPWLSWGPYLWADGLVPRSDGLVWLCTDLGGDGTHPSAAGARKVANLLLDFVHTDPTARIWYQHAGVPPPGA